MTNKYYEKHKERLRKEESENKKGSENIKILLKKKKTKGVIRIFLRKKSKNKFSIEEFII